MLATGIMADRRREQIAESREQRADRSQEQAGGRGGRSITVSVNTRQTSAGR